MTTDGQNPNVDGYIEKPGKAVEYYVEIKGPKVKELYDRKVKQLVLNSTSSTTKKYEGLVKVFSESGMVITVSMKIKLSPQGSDINNIKDNNK
jgi:hypothetical protein